MIRGRHRGLPVAIDRSILLPSDLEALHGPPSDNASTQSPNMRSPHGTFSSLEKGATRSSVIPPRTRTRTRTASSGMRRFSGGQPARRMASGVSAASRSSNPRKDSSTGAQSIQFAPTPVPPVRRETPSRPTLNGYLSTIYSEAPSPAVTPNSEREEDGPPKQEETSSTAISANGSASTSSGDKDAITLADKSDEK